MVGLRGLSTVATVLLLVTLVDARSVSRPRSVSYEGQHVYRCVINGSAHAGRLATDPDLDVWKISRDGTADIRTLNAQGKDTLKSLGCDNVVISNINQWLDQQQTASHKARKSQGNFSSSLEWFEDYHPYEGIIAFYTSLAAEYSELVTLTSSIGQSLELRPMPAVKITTANDPQTPKILLTCQIHAREWVSSSTCMFIAQSLVDGFQTSPVIRDILSKAEIHIIPFLNPDGYVYTWTTDRLWRKNRRLNPGSNCRGVDLNRNFNIRWAEPGGGSSNNPCSETYHGTTEESEPEIEHTVNYFKLHPPIIAGIDYHSYSQLILRPWGFTLDPPPHEQQLKAVGDSMEEVIRSVHGQTYISQPGMDLYPTVGTSSDWYFSEDANEG